jgi:uncharacterized membrane protein YkvI
MNNKEEIRHSRNVTQKDLIQAVIIVAAILILGWYKETGSKIAALIFAIIPVIGVIYYLRIPAEKRQEAEQEANAELRKSPIGKLWIGFLWTFGIVSIFLIIQSLTK